MKILFSHNNYPSQFRRLLPFLVDAGHEIIFIASGKEWHAPQPCGYKVIFYQNHRDTAGPWQHPYLRRFESSVLEGQSAYRCSLKLKENGWYPDVIVSHSGFGNGLYLLDAFPHSHYISLFEWFYNSKDSDVDFFDLPGTAPDPDRAPRVRSLNSTVLLELAACHHAVVPTLWQRNQFPEFLRSRFSVIHEGIDVTELGSLRSDSFPTPDCLPRDVAVEVLTYVSRGFEEYRGFPQVMQAIQLLQQQRPNLHCLIVGADDVAYGSKRNDGRSWGQWALENLSLDDDRTHWLGSLQTSEYHKVLAASDVHLYFTAPFVLSWSLLESMAAGCAIVASNTPPVLEAIEDGLSGLLVDFFDVPAIAESVCRILDRPQLASVLRDGAQQKARQFDSRLGLSRWSELIVGRR